MPSAVNLFSQATPRLRRDCALCLVKWGSLLLLFTSRCGGHVAVERASAFVCRRGAIVALGAASGELIANSFYDRLYNVLLMRRWGHLVEVPYPEGSQRLQHGLMHATYTRHYKRPSDCRILSLEDAASVAEPLTHDVTFTASTSAGGTLLLGTHRMFPLVVCNLYGTVVALRCTCDSGQTTLLLDACGVPLSASEKEATQPNFPPTNTP
jgi:hypothetical protein